MQSNLHDYAPVRMNEVPSIELQLIKSAESLGGVGEIGTAVVIPSVMNAIHAATGKRFRSYPVASEQLKA